MKRAFVYLRVSTGEQAKGFSLDAQLDEITKYCEDNKIEVLEKFSDSMSGTKLTERKGYFNFSSRINFTI